MNVFVIFGSNLSLQVILKEWKTMHLCGSIRLKSFDKTDSDFSSCDVFFDKNVVIKLQCILKSSFELTLFLDKRHSIRVVFLAWLNNHWKWESDVLRNGIRSLKELSLW